jgi:hypothetical protein
MVRIIYYLLLALHDKHGHNIFEQAQTRQTTRYSTFLSRKRIKEWQDVNNKGKATKRRKPTNEVGASFCVLVETQGNDDEEEEELPQSAFPYCKDLLFRTNHNDKVPFDCKDKSIEFICYNLNRHGFGFLLHEDLDEIQLDLLMILSWHILQQLHGKTDHFPNKDTINVLSNYQDTQAMFVSVLPTEDGGEIDKPTFLEATCKLQLRHTSPHQEIDLSKRDVEGTIEYQYSLSIPGCIPKHRRKHPPLIHGTGYSGAILSDMPTFLAYVKYMLCYHAWCHDSHLLPIELQQDYDLIDFGSRMLVRYFDSILYRSDDTCDTDTCKIHTQLHNSQSHCYFGDLMQDSTAMGECGLMVWVKGVSQTALKQGIDKFTYSTSSRVGERILLETITNQLEMQNDKEQQKPMVQPCISKRQLPHFRYQREEDTVNSLKSLNQKGHERNPDTGMGVIQQ